MKLTVKQLRQVIESVINEITDQSLDTGDEVSTIYKNKLIKGKIIDKFAARHVDPAAGQLLKKKSGMMWVVNVGGKTIPLPADELTLVSKAQPKLKSREVSTDQAGAPLPESATMGRSSMLHGSEGEKDGEELDEIDDAGVEEIFDDSKYDSMARMLVNKWSDKEPHVNWLSVAKSYADALRSSTGKKIDTNKLYNALITTCEHDDDETSPEEHAQPQAYQKAY